jgi:hypothetical protein
MQSCGSPLTPVTEGGSSDDEEDEGMELWTENRDLYTPLSSLLSLLTTAYK